MGKGPNALREKRREDTVRETGHRSGPLTRRLHSPGNLKTHTHIYTKTLKTSAGALVSNGEQIASSDTARGMKRRIYSHGTIMKAGGAQIFTRYVRVCGRRDAENESGEGERD